MTKISINSYWLSPSKKSNIVEKHLHSVSDLGSKRTSRKISEVNLEEGGTY